MKTLLLHLLFIALGFGIGWRPQSNPSVPATSATSSKPAAAIPTAAASSPSEPKPAVPSASPVEQMRLSFRNGDHWANGIALVEKLTPAQMPQALEVVLSHPAPGGRRRLVSMLFEQWAKLDLPGAVQAVSSIASPQLKSAALHQVLSAWAQTDLKAAWQWAVANDADTVMQDRAVETLMGLGGDLDTQTFATLAEQITEPFLREKALKNLLESWVGKDPPAAFQHLRTIQPPSLRSSLLGWCAVKTKEPENALPLLLQMPPSPAVEDALSSLTSMYYFKDPDVAWQWLVSQSANPLMQGSINTMGRLLGERKASADALLTSARQLPAGPARDAFLNGVSRDWITPATLDDALRLLPLLSPGIERSHYIGKLGAAFGKSPSPKAEAWLRSLPRGVMQDHAIEGFSSGASTTHSQLAAEWATRISNPLQRQETLKTTWETWTKNDPGKANAWLWASPALSPQDRQQLQSKP